MKPTDSLLQIPQKPLCQHGLREALDLGDLLDIVGIPLIQSFPQPNTSILVKGEKILVKQLVVILAQPQPIFSIQRILQTLFRRQARSLFDLETGQTCAP